LIRLGRFDVDDWHDAFGKDSAIRLFRSSSEAEDPMNCVSTKAIIATLPLVLLYHENEIKLRQNVKQLVAGWQNDPVNRDGALAVGYAIAQSLTEKLNRTTLIPQIIAFLGESETQLAQHLAQVQTLLEQGAGLERAVTELRRDAQPSNPIALAFYCFLSTLEDLQLSVRRAAQTPYQPQITSAITGALSGAYNSIAGIPATLRMALTRSDAKPLAAWGMKTEAEMLELSDSLVAVWSGVYDQGTHPAQPQPVAAIAAPHVIRPR
jgi:ADP-ribosylglycohydrolase